MKIHVVDVRDSSVSELPRVVLILDDLSTFILGLTGSDGVATLRYPGEAKPAHGDLLAKGAWVSIM